VIIDASGMIVAVNDTWKEFGRRNGLSIPNAGVGVNYLQYCAGSEFTRELRGLLAGRLDLLTLVYPCHSLGEKRWFSLIGVPLSPAKPAGVALLHVNLTGMLPPQIGGSLTQVAATTIQKTLRRYHFPPESGHVQWQKRCPLSAKSGRLVSL
jgi:hypothetical protein